MTATYWVAITVVYILGYLAMYFLFRFLITKRMHEAWTLQERLIGLVFSLLSWIGILFYAVVYLLGKYGKINLSKEIKW